ncbi:MAG: thiamine pyrophosphate-binding protein [Quadrisphaera sp.]
MSHTAADQLVDLLLHAGVQRVYGIVGDSLNAFSDAVRRRGGAAEGGIDWVHVHNEEAAAFAASAEAQLTGRLAVCAGSCGPGNTHLIQGVMDAHRSGAPVLAIASHIPSSQVGTGFFQETDPKALFAQAAHYCEEVAHPEQLERLVRLAAQNALGRGGASVLVVSGDVLSAPAAPAKGLGALVTGRPLAVPRPEEVEELAGHVQRSDKVAIFAGIGAADARDDVIRLAGLLQAPIGHSLRGKDAFGYDNPHDVGMNGLLGYGGCYKALHDADLVLLLGTDFPYEDFLPGARTIQVDLDPARLGRRTPLVQGIAADVGATVRALLDRVPQRAQRSFLDEALHRTESAVDGRLAAYTSEDQRGGPLHPELVATVLDELMADDAVVTADTGMCCTWTARYLTPNGSRRFIGSWVHGSMANALPMAIGAQVSHPGRQVVSFSGDGGLAMLLGELLTVKLHQLPVKTVVFNNSSLGMVRLEMLAAGDPPFETDHDAVDYAAIAAGAGVFSRRVERAEDLRSAVAEVLAHPGPALLDVVTTADAMSMPSHTTVGQAKGFALSLGKMVLDGGISDAVRLARTNVRLARP